MQPPATIDQFLELLRKSELLDEKDLDAYLQQRRAAADLPNTPGKLAGALMRDGLLTHFQAEQLLRGKHRGFTIGGRYTLLERLGSGGMGSVFLCEHKIMRRRVALKMLPAAQAADPASLERFHREARAAAALDHPNLVRAYEVDHEGKFHFLIMEHVDGASLQEIVKRSGPMDVLRAAHYIRQAAVGLHHAHQAGLVHRDIKPGNVLVDRGGTVKVLDMGLALFFNDKTDNLTKQHDAGSVLGTADYLAPEQAVDSHSVDIRADIYSLGATFYFLLTGSSPFSEGTLRQKLIWHQLREPESIRTLRPEVPEGLVAVIERMMAKEPDGRYQTPAELVEALAQWTQELIPSPPDEEMPRLCRAAGGGGLMDPLVRISKPGSEVLAGSSVQVGAVPPRGPMTGKAGRAAGAMTGKAVRPLADSGSGKVAAPPRTRVLSGASYPGSDATALADTDRREPATQVAADMPSSRKVFSARRLRYAVAASVGALGLIVLTGVAFWMGRPENPTDPQPVPAETSPPPSIRSWALYDRPETLKEFLADEEGQRKGAPSMPVQRLHVTGPYPTNPTDPALPAWPAPRPVLVISDPKTWGFFHPLQDLSLGQRVLTHWQRLVAFPPLRPEDNLLRGGTFDGDCLATVVNHPGAWRGPIASKEGEQITVAQPPDRPGNPALLLVRKGPADGKGLISFYQSLGSQKPGTVMVLRFRARAEEGNGRLSVIPCHSLAIPKQEQSLAASQLRSRSGPLPVDKRLSLPDGSDGYWYQLKDWVTPQAEWQTYYLIWEWPSFATIGLHRIVQIFYGGFGKVWLDDVELFVWESGATP